MSTILPSPIYYGYDESPFVRKLETILLLRNIPARRVDVALYPPRPELSSLLGLPYRRVPVLALGRDIYVDTSLITYALEHHFPAGPQRPSIFPPSKGTTPPASANNNAALQAMFTQFYADKHLFRLGFELLPWEKVSPAVRDDRKQFAGRSMDMEGLAARRSMVHSTVSSHLVLYEAHLNDGREWFLDTVTPALIDVSIHFVLSWMRSFRASRPVFDAAEYPFTIAWLDRMDALLASKRQPAGSASPLLTKISGTDAAQEILSSPYSDKSDLEIGFDKVEAKRLRVTHGARVSVTPDDTGRDVPTFGKLVALSRREMVLETASGPAGDDGRPGPGPPIRVHFPRLGYVVQEATSKL